MNGRDGQDVAWADAACADAASGGGAPRTALSSACTSTVSADILPSTFHGCFGAIASASWPFKTAPPAVPSSAVKFNAPPTIFKLLLNATGNAGVPTRRNAPKSPDDNDMFSAPAGDQSTNFKLPAPERSKPSLASLASTRIS